MDYLSYETASSPAVPEERVRGVPVHLLALAGILLLSACLNFWQLDRLGMATPTTPPRCVPCAELAQLLLQLVRPGGFVTIDKPPLGFWFQVASAKLFGFNGVSLLLPEALAGVLSVALLYHLVKRVFGIGAGLLAAL